ncbi:hypothetical protein B296_00023140 [Ensete ventricosum]|uniref:Serine-threonine/tyrosine-protein kinase catalytic domain-containing protein n=1 Tax=Ensete ventricosum TaxID=4639 RepID=A0A426YLL5_ENSVE|nr:hypothetical protein B296_00023140 [Ensete ventricosum]
MGLLSFTKKKGERMIDCLCCFRSWNEKKMKAYEAEKRIRKMKPPKDEAKKKKKKSLLFRRKKTMALNEEKKKKRNRLFFLKRKKKKSSKDETKKKKRNRLFFLKRKKKKSSKDETKKKRRNKLFFLKRKKKKSSKDETKKKRKIPTEQKKTSTKRQSKKFWWRRKGQNKAINLASLVHTMSFRSAEEILRIGSDNIAARVFTYRELAAATGSFSSENLLGEGGFGRAEPLFKDKRQFVAMADPLLEGKYPIKGLYQALAIAAMCLQEEANIRPLISDVLTALEHLANPNNDEDDGPQAFSLEMISQHASTSGSEMAVHDTGEATEEILESHSYPEANSFSSREHDLNELDAI